MLLAASGMGACGSTETGPCALNPPFGRKMPGSIGLPAPGVLVAVVDEDGFDLTTLSLRTKQIEFLEQSGVPGWAYDFVSPAARLATRATVVKSSMDLFHKHG